MVVYVIFLICTSTMTDTIENAQGWKVMSATIPYHKWRKSILISAHVVTIKCAVGNYCDHCESCSSEEWNSVQLCMDKLAEQL